MKNMSSLNSVLNGALKSAGGLFYSYRVDAGKFGSTEWRRISCFRCREVVS